MIFFLILLASCDPTPTNKFVPPGGFAREPERTGKAAIRAVLYTPSHGVFRTVREAVVTYMGKATDGVKVAGWSAQGVTEGAVPHYNVNFDWHDGRRARKAQWELNRYGVWPMNAEAKILTVYPPAP